MPKDAFRRSAADSNRDVSPLFVGSPVAQFVLDRTSGIVHANRAAATLLRADAERLIGRRLVRFVVEEDALAFLRVISDLEVEGLRSVSEFRFLTDRGERRHLRIDAVALPPTDGGGRCQVALIDLTAEREIEERRLAAADRLRLVQNIEAIGRMSGSVAHHLNSLLLVIQGHAERLADLPTPCPDARAAAAESAEAIEQACESASKLARRLVRGHAARTIRFEELDLHAVMDRLESRLLSIVPPNVNLVSSRAEEPLPVRTDAGELERTLLDLVLNACDAMPDGGKLSIVCRKLGDGQSVEDDPADESASAGERVLIEIHDTGHGMDAETRARVFEPFYSTKPGREGMGLGLTAAYWLVVASGGHLEVESAPGRGSSFRLYLPFAARSADSRSEAPRPTPIRTARATVLVCEDNAAERNLLVKILTGSGYDVLSAPDGREALEIADGEDVKIDVLITDVSLPRLNGYDLAERLVARHPGARVLFISGYTRDVLAQEDLAARGWRFLEKPFRLKELLDCVRQTLDARVRGT